MEAWKLLADLELWWTNLQLGEFRLSASLVVTFFLLGIACIVIGYPVLKVAIWRDRAERADRLPRTAIVVSPAPSIWPKVIVAVLVAANAAIIWYLW
jgi:hypothetical protein